MAEEEGQDEGRRVYGMDCTETTKRGTRLGWFGDWGCCRACGVLKGMFIVVLRNRVRK